MAEKKSSVAPFAIKKAGDEDPFLTFKFWVLKDDKVFIGAFKECSGLRMERTVETIEEGGVNDHAHTLPGRNKYSNITLKHGVMQSNALWSWYNEGLYDCKVSRIDFSILLSDRAGKHTKRWDVTGAFPVKWEGPSLNVEQSQVAVETLEIAFQTMKQSTVATSGT